MKLRASRHPAWRAIPHSHDWLLLKERGCDDASVGVVARSLRGQRYEERTSLLKVQIIAESRLSSAEPALQRHGKRRLPMRRRSADGLAEADVSLDSGQSILAEVTIKLNRALFEEQNYDRSAQLEESLVIAFANSCARLVALLNGSNRKRADFDYGDPPEMVGIE